MGRLPWRLDEKLYSSTSWRTIFSRPIRASSVSLLPSNHLYSSLLRSAPWPHAVHFLTTEMRSPTICRHSNSFRASRVCVPTQVFLFSLPSSYCPNCFPISCLLRFFASSTNILHHGSFRHSPIILLALSKSHSSLSSLIAIHSRADSHRVTDLPSRELPLSSLGKAAAQAAYPVRMNPQRCSSETKRMAETSRCLKKDERNLASKAKANQKPSGRKR